MKVSPKTVTRRYDVSAIKPRLSHETSIELSENIPEYHGYEQPSVQPKAMFRNTLSRLLERYKDYDVLLGTFGSITAPLGFYTVKNFPHIRELPKADRYTIEKLGEFLQKWKLVNERNEDITSLWTPKDSLVVGRWTQIDG